MPDTLTFDATPALLAALAAQLAHLEDMIKEHEDMNQLRAQRLGERLGDLEAVLISLQYPRRLTGHVVVPHLGRFRIELLEDDRTP
jgi:hypothetical protein